MRGIEVGTIKRRIVAALVALVMIGGMGPLFTDNAAWAAAAKPGRVKIKSAVYKGNSLYVKWGKVKGAKSYQIYLKKGKGKYKKIATVKKPQTYRIKDLKWKTKYTVKMRAVNGKKKGKWSRQYQHKFGRKQTLQTVATDQDVINEVAELEREMDGEFQGTFTTRIGFKGNNMYMNLTSTQLFSNANVADLNASFRESFSKKDTKKSMNKTVKDMEYNTGLSGIHLIVVFYNSDGGLIYKTKF